MNLHDTRKKNSAGRFTSNLHVDRWDKFATRAALDKPNPKLASNTSRLVPDAKVVVSRSLMRNTLPSDVSNLENTPWFVGISTVENAHDPV